MVFVITTRGLETTAGGWVGAYGDAIKQTKTAGRTDQPRVERQRVARPLQGREARRQHPRLGARAPGPEQGGGAAPEAQGRGQGHLDGVRLVRAFPLSQDGDFGVGGGGRGGGGRRGGGVFGGVVVAGGAVVGVGPEEALRAELLLMVIVVSGVVRVMWVWDRMVERASLDHTHILFIFKLYAYINITHPQPRRDEPHDLLHRQHRIPRRLAALAAAALCIGINRRS